MGEEGQTFKEAFDSLVTFAAGELISMIHKNAVIHVDDSEKTYYVAHQILNSRDVSKLLLSEVSRLLAVGIH